MRRDRRSRRRHGDYGESYEIAAALWDHPMTSGQIVDHFHGYLRLMGLFSVWLRLQERRDSSEEHFTEVLQEMIERGWVVQRGELYDLTSVGREEGGRYLAEMRDARRSLVRLRARVMTPETVSKVSLGVHLTLAAVKLPAALLSGSVGLLNDALDTLLDGLSSLLVYAGLRLDKERAVNCLLVVFMLGTGSLTLYQAARRFFTPFQPDVDWFTFLATILSAVVCAALYFYQRYVGLRSASIALITQSVDSRNHVIVAASVTAGLVASLLDFPLLDTLVGLAVALLILKSTVELAAEVVRSLGDESVDLSHYRIALVDGYKGFRRAQLGDWMLYVVEAKGVLSRSDLVARAHEALDFGGNPVLRELELSQRADAAELIQSAVAELYERGWLAGDEVVSLTSAGRKRLQERLRGRHDRHGATSRRHGANRRSGRRERTGRRTE